MEKPFFIWSDYIPEFQIEENYTPEGLHCVYPPTQTSRKKAHDWEIIRTVYTKLRKIAQKTSDNYKKVLYIDYDYCNYPFEMVARVEQCGGAILASMVLWSEDQDTQATARETFDDWRDVESLYCYMQDKVTRTQERIRQNRIEREIAEKQAAERRIRRAAPRDPDNPAARKRKARRHLQRLGYDLHKSRRLALTAEDRGQYQIVRLDSGEIIAGARFDLSLDEVERFYMDCDFERVEKKTCFYLNESGFLYNQEPKLKERKAAAEKALGKMGYALEVGEYKKEYYRNSCYQIRLLRNKRNMEIIKQGGERYVKNGKEDTFTLSEVEDFIAAKGHWKR